MTDQRHLLSIVCPNRPGIVATVSQRIFEGGANILESNQFDDVLTGRFFMRLVFNCPGGEQGLPDLRRDMADIAQRFAMDLTLRPADQRQRVMILVSAFDHCLVDLLYRWRIGELKMDVTAIVSNHPKSTFEHASLEDLPFHHLPITAQTKAEQERKLLALIEETRTDLVVLARYMQVLSDEMTAKLSGRCINIHHSFLPGFKGAKPYHQAHARGVKLIGATAHYVTPDLDEGPIIEQDVERVSHSDSPDDLVRKGRDIERRVLSRAVGFHLADRVLGNGHTTVVFRD